MTFVLRLLRGLWPQRAPATRRDPVTAEAASDAGKFEDFDELPCGVDRYGNPILPPEKPRRK